jgi:hypothetical protein
LPSDLTIKAAIAKARQEVESTERTWDSVDPVHIRGVSFGDITMGGVLLVGSTSWASVVDLTPVTNRNGVVTASSLTRRHDVLYDWLVLFDSDWLCGVFVPEAGERAQRYLGEMVARRLLVEATEFHVLRQRDGAVGVMPLPEDEPGEDSQVALTAPISPNAPNGRARALDEMDGYLAA